MNILDTLEPHFTKSRWQKKTPPRWIAVTSPSVLLRPEETYPVGLYLREAGLGVLFPTAILVLSKVAVVAWVWHDYPVLFEDQHYHKLLIGIFSHLGYYHLPYILLVWVLFSYALHFPKFYFWNRRTARLQSQPPEASAYILADADPNVWPPAPVKSVSP